jgi:D-glycero-beta-D-manno-heptose 1-phosphate adenylyltransferase
VLVKGGDWKVKDIVGGDFVSSRGGKVASIPFVKGYSTTATLKKIAAL